MCCSTEASVASTERRRAPFSWKRWRLKRASSRPASLGTSSGPAAQCLACSLCGMCWRKEKTKATKTLKQVLSSPRWARHAVVERVLWARARSLMLSNMCPRSTRQGWRAMRLSERHAFWRRHFQGRRPRRLRARERLPPTACSMDEAVEDADGGHERASFGGEASVRFNRCRKGGSRWLSRRGSSMCVVKAYSQEPAAPQVTGEAESCAKWEEWLMPAV